MSLDHRNVCICYSAQWCDIASKRWDGGDSVVFTHGLRVDGRRVVLCPSWVSHGAYFCFPSLVSAALEQFESDKTDLRGPNRRVDGIYTSGVWIRWVRIEEWVNHVHVWELDIVLDILIYSDPISTNTGLSHAAGLHHNPNTAQLYLLKVLPPFINNSKLFLLCFSTLHCWRFRAPMATFAGLF